MENLYSENVYFQCDSKLGFKKIKLKSLFKNYIYNF